MTADISKDYAHYPTLSPLPEGIETENAYICCPGCGCASFRLRKYDHALICADCRQELTDIFSDADAHSFGQQEDSLALYSPDTPMDSDALDDYLHQRLGDNLPEEVYQNLRRFAEVGGFDPASDIPDAEPDYDVPQNTVPADTSAHRFQFVRTKQHSVVLRPDGTVQAIGVNNYGQCNVQDWENINAVAATPFFTVGLGVDGKIRYAGNNWLTRSKFNGWSNITAIAAGSNFVAGLCRDGSVKAYNFRVPVYSGITAIAAGANHLVALSMDGSVRAVGPNSYGMCNVQDWSDVTAVAAGNAHTVALREDGTVLATGYKKRGKFEKINRCEVQEWQSMSAIAAGSQHTVGLRSDGRVYAVGDNKDGQCNVWDWTDVIAITAGETYTAALRSDGTVLCTDPTVKKLIDEAYQH